MEYKIELWQQAAEWLRECIPLDPSIRFKRLEEFAAFLKDGFALCALANKLANGCVPQVHRNYNTGTSQVSLIFPILLSILFSLLRSPISRSF
jgi:hypothetical protein